MEKLVREAVDQLAEGCKGKSAEDKKWIAIAKAKKEKLKKKGKK